MVQYIGLNHRSRHIPMPQQFLDHADVMARLQQMGSEALALMPSLALEA
jgi:hypothetical protein